MEYVSLVLMRIKNFGLEGQGKIQVKKNSFGLHGIRFLMHLRGFQSSP
jgi:hypothetical protein